MERAFSVDDILESFWAASPALAPAGLPPHEGGGEGGFMNRSASEWCFEEFLQVAAETEASASASLGPEPNRSPIADPVASTSVVGSTLFGNRRDLGGVGDDEVVETKAPAAPQFYNPPLLDDPGEYQALLTKKLHMFCAAVAMSRGPSVNPPDSDSVAESRSPISDASQLGSQVPVNVNASKVRHTASGVPSGDPALSMLQNTVTQGRPATSNSSREQSDDEDELEGEAETNDMDPSDVKRQRRMLSNRESARRSRRRKQAPMSELEVQVSQLRLDNSTLLNSLTDLNKKHTDAAVDNRILKADLATLRAKMDSGGDNATNSTDISPITGSNEEQQPISSNNSNVSKTKTTKKASWIWDHFTKVDSEHSSVPKAKCNYCESLISCISANGTSGMINHLKRCKIYIANSVDKRQKTLETIIEHGCGGKGKATIVPYSFSQEECRKALVKMIIVDELPFKFVEREGFHEYCAKMQPRFLIPSRTTITRDCYELFVEKKKELKSLFSKLPSRVCLTSDTWTSCQNLNYMSLTAHFIDDNWQLHKKIINFCPIPSHVGEVIGKAIEKCLLEWGIDRVFSVTVDHASSNDLCIDYLRKRLNSWKGSVLNGKYLHMRCAAHVMSLTVKEGLKEIDDSIARIRSAVRYVRSSPARLQRFKSCVEKEKIKCNNNVCLDVETRWNSTYLMLDSAIKYQKAFELLDIQDNKFGDDLNSKKGVPTEIDWNYARGLMPFLKIFYDATTKLSGSLYATSNLYGKEIFSLGMIITKYCNSDNLSLRIMASNMLRKHKKYWGNVETINVMIFIAIILDPRCKQDYVSWIIDESYGMEEAIVLKDKVVNVLTALFNSYAASIPSATSTQSQAFEIPSEMDVDTLVCVDYLNLMYKKQKGGQEALEKKTELDKYLKEDCEDPTCTSFDILCWWKVNAPRYPILSLMARDVLAFPVSTVASESAFSTGGRVLDSFRSSLTPRIVEALICAQDWLRRSETPFILEEALDELEKLESDMTLSCTTQIDVE